MAGTKLGIESNVWGKDIFTYLENKDTSLRDKLNAIKKYNLICGDLTAIDYMVLLKSAINNSYKVAEPQLADSATSLYDYIETQRFCSYSCGGKFSSSTRFQRSIDSILSKS